MRHCPAIVLTLSLLLVGCADRLGHEPTIETVQVNKEVAVPCDAKLPQRPDLLNKDQLRAKLDTIPKMGDRAKLVLDQLLLYMGWEPVQGAAIAGCTRSKGQNSPTIPATTR